MVQGEARASAGDKHGLSAADEAGERTQHRLSREVLPRRRRRALGHDDLQPFCQRRIQQPLRRVLFVMDLRKSRAGRRILTHRPLAIHVPAERLALWQTGRAEYRIASKKARYRDVELDILRQYVLIYEWVKGVSADEALLQLSSTNRRRILTQLTPTRSR